MKVLIILNGLGNEGVTTIALTYLFELLNTDIEFQVVAAGPCDTEKLNELIRENIVVYQFPSRKVQTKKYIMALVKLLKRNKYDAVHIHGNSATMGIDLLVALICGCKIRIAHCHNTKCDSERLNKILKPLLMATATERFACGVDSGKWLYGNKDFEVIQNGRDVEKYKYSESKRNDIRKKLGINSKDVLIGHVGTFTYQKNQARLIQLLHELKRDMDYSYKLVLAGDGPLKEMIENDVRKFGLKKNVIFVGNVNNVCDYLSAFDIMVLPSRYEGLPLVAIEGQANGLPCVFSTAITRECKVLENVKFVSLSEDDKIWKMNIRELLKIGRIENSEHIKSLMKKKRFDIKSNALHLKALYDGMITNK